MATPTTVQADGIRLAVTDHGGSGPTLVLTHGLGGSQRALVKMVPFLTPHVRLVTYDLRGHGKSGYAPWSWRAAVRDLEAVVVFTGDPTAAVAGHSLGGMIAAMYGEEHRECIGAINIDGWGTGTADLYPTSDPVEVEAWLERTRTGGIPVLKVLNAILRLLPGGKQKVRVSHEVLVALSTVDLMQVHQATQVPLLAFNASGPSRGLQKLLTTKKADTLLTDYRQGIHLKLQQLHASDSRIVEAEMPTADHGLILTHAEETCEHIIRFLGITSGLNPKVVA